MNSMLAAVSAAARGSYSDAEIQPSRSAENPRAVISTLCTLAGTPHLAAGLIRRGATPTQAAELIRREAAFHGSFRGADLAAALDGLASQVYADRSMSRRAMTSVELETQDQADAEAIVPTRSGPLAAMAADVYAQRAARRR